MPNQSAKRETTLDLEFRPATTDDTPLINATFLNAARASSYGSGCDNAEFFGAFRRAWTACRAEMATTVAYPVGQPDHIIGYVVHGELPARPGEAPHLAVAWLFVTREWRGMGAGRRLLEAAGVTLGVRFLALWAHAPRDLIKARRVGYEPTFAPWAMLRWL